VATALREHVSIEGEEIVFDFPAKSGQRRLQSIRDPAVKLAIEAMRRRRSGPDDLLVFREDGAWRDVRSEEVNAYLQEKAGEEFSAKDFRTWHGTVLAAVELARQGAPASKGGAERAIRAAIKRVAERLGNTPAVARSSYVDPRVLDRFRDGKTVELPNLAPEGTVTPRQQGLIERRVLELIE
jgi:DNA topoisomerase-1